MKILIVDDEIAIIEYTMLILNNAGFETLSAYSAKEALKIFHDQCPGIIVTDLRLGGDMDGVALCSRILHEDNSVVVIAMSGYFSEYDKAYCQGVGFTEALAKPINPDHLISAINCAVERRQRWKRLP